MTTELMKSTIAEVAEASIRTNIPPTVPTEGSEAVRIHENTSSVCAPPKVVAKTTGMYPNISPQPKVIFSTADSSPELEEIQAEAHAERKRIFESREKQLYQL